MAGIGIINSTRKRAAASALVDFMLSATQAHTDAHEIPVADRAAPDKGTPSAAELAVLGLDPRQLQKLDRARRLLTETGTIG